MKKRLFHPNLPNTKTSKTLKNNNR